MVVVSAMVVLCVGLAAVAAAIQFVRPDMVQCANFVNVVGSMCVVLLMGVEVVRFVGS